MEDITPSLIYYNYIRPHGTADYLRSQGYDIITFNLTDPFSPIEVNAKILVNFIEYINNRKKSNEELIIMGVSMGGLIVRYALTYMEENNMQHETKLFISFDTPHEGAYIPLSLQELSADYYKNFFPYLLFVLDGHYIMDLYLKLRSPAAIEMNLFDYSKTINGNVNHGNCFDTFFDDIKSLNNCGGYPKTCKNIAISNGSLKGELQNGLNVLGNTSGNTAIKFHINSYPLWKHTLTTVAGSDNLSAKGTCAYLRNFGFCDSEEYGYIKNNREPIERTPGGYYPWYSMVEKVINSNSIFELDEINNRDATFIPMYSSLDLYTNNPLIDLTSFGKSTTLDNCPFDDIWWEPTHVNLEHNDLTNDIGAYIRNQIINFSSSDNYCKDYDLNLTNVTISFGKRKLYKVNLST